MVLSFKIKLYVRVKEGSNMSVVLKTGTIHSQIFYLLFYLLGIVVLKLFDLIVKKHKERYLR